MAILEPTRLMHRRTSPAWIAAVVLFAITSHRPAFAQGPANCVNQGYSPAAGGYYTQDCSDDEGMWDRFTDYCSDVGCKFRDWRRKMYWRHHSSHKSLMYEDIPPYHSANYGYFQTCWTPMQDCPRCPEINYTTPGSSARTQMSQPQMSEPPMTLPVPPVAPEPAGDQPPPPPTSESSPYFPPAEDAKPEPIPPPVQAPPEEFGWKKSAQPLNRHFKLLSPQEEWVATSKEPVPLHQLVAAEEELVVVTSDDQQVSEPHPFFPILPVDVVLPNDGWEAYQPRVPGIIIRARGDWQE